MYRCDVCDRVTEPSVPCHQIAVETEPIAHPRRPEIYWRPPRGNEKGKWIDDPGGAGTRIVREVKACAECAAKLLALERARRAPARRRA